MFDMRNYSKMIGGLTAKANSDDEGWKWSVKSISKMKARIFWEYLEFLGYSNPFFTIELENTDDGCWIKALNELGETIDCEIVEDHDLPFLNTAPDKAIRMMFAVITNAANDLY